jgi:hypothetical protein
MNNSKQIKPLLLEQASRLLAAAYTDGMIRVNGMDLVDWSWYMQCDDNNYFDDVPYSEYKLIDYRKGQYFSFDNESQLVDLSNKVDLQPRW